MESHEVKEAGSIKLSTGVNVIARISKNKLTGKERYAYFPIYYDYGIDDIGSSVDFLVDSKHWTKVKGTIDASEFGYTGNRAGLIEHIERNNLEVSMKNLMGQRWNNIEEMFRIDRKSKY